jgi:anti-sigma factor RsiW
VRQLVDAWVDGELDVVREMEIEAHLKACGHCSALYEAQRRLRSGLGQHDLYYRAPAGLRERVRGAAAASGGDLAGSEGRRFARMSGAGAGHWRAVKTPGFWPALGMAAAIVFFTVAGVIMLRARPSPTDRLPEEVVAAHIRSLLPGHLADVPSSDQHTVKPWFAGRVDFSPPVTDFSARGFPLVGGRLDYVGGRTVAVAAYKRGQHILNLFMWPAAEQAAVKTNTSRGYNTVHWANGVIAFWLVSDLNLAELRAFADLLRTGQSAP